MSLSVSPETSMEEVSDTPSSLSVDTLKIFASSTIYCVEGTEIPISHAFTLERVIPSIFAKSVCVYFFDSLKTLILLKL